MFSIIKSTNIRMDKKLRKAALDHIIMEPLTIKKSDLMMDRLKPFLDRRPELYSDPNWQENPEAKQFLDDLEQRYRIDRKRLRLIPSE